MTHQHYSQKNRERCSLGLFNAFNPDLVSICPIEPLVLALQAKSVPNSASKNSTPRNLTLLHHHDHLQSERLGRLFLHLSVPLNPAVPSICLWDRWLWSYKQKKSQKFPPASYNHMCVCVRRNRVMLAHSSGARPEKCAHHGHRRRTTTTWPVEEGRKRADDGEVSGGCGGGGG